jgi:hypothetical protein
MNPVEAAGVITQLRYFKEVDEAVLRQAIGGVMIVSPG